MEPMHQDMLEPGIAARVASVAAEKAMLAAAILGAQYACEHRFVSETPWKGSDYFAPLNAQRICNHCRLIEEGSHWSGGSTWSRSDYKKPMLGNVEGRIVREIDRETFYRMRISA